METDCQHLVGHYTPRLYRLAFSYCRSRQDAEDVVQEVFEKYLRADPKFQTEDQRNSWLLKVTVNTCRDLLRSPWRRRTCPLEEAAEPAVWMEEESALMTAVLGLKEKYRVVVHLYYYEDRTVAQIAKILGISESAVRMRLQRARQTLKKELEGAWQDE